MNIKILILVLLILCVGCKSQKEPKKLDVMLPSDIHVNQPIIDSQQIRIDDSINAIIRKQKDFYNTADSLTIRLQPSRFSILPNNIVLYLEENGYTIPQSWFDTVPHNVISGNFSHTSQIDWAVLASKNLNSSIKIFWNGLTDSISDIEIVKDRIFLQGVDVNTIGYSRRITVVVEDRLKMHTELNEDTQHYIIDHQGIEDAFIGKASSIQYFYKGNWFSIGGAD